MKKLLLIVTIFFSLYSSGQSPMFKLIAKRASAAPYTYILDSLTTDTAQTAYSFRKLREGYSGSCIRVRESGGNTEQDINFVDNFLDTASMKTFVGANSGYIVTIYDQTTNARDATNSTAGEQPRIINAGAVEYDNGHVAARWLGAGYKLSTTAYTAYPDSMTSNFVMRVVSGVSFNASVTKTTTNRGYPLDAWTQRVFSSNGTSSTSLLMTTSFNLPTSGGTWTAKVKTASADGIKSWFNGSTNGSALSAYYTDGSVPLIIGSRADGATSFNGYFFEAITFSAISETELLDGLHANQMNYYGY